VVCHAVVVSGTWKLKRYTRGIDQRLYLLLALGVGSVLVMVCNELPVHRTMRIITLGAVSGLSSLNSYWVRIFAVLPIVEHAWICSCLRPCYIWKERLCKNCWRVRNKHIRTVFR
jgi:hypothetical protein